MSPKKLFRRLCGPRLSGWVGCHCENCLKQACFAHFGWPGTIPNKPISHKFGLELMTSPKKSPRRLCGPRSSGCVATMKNCLKQAFFAHFGRPGTIPSGPIGPKFGPEGTIGP